MLVASYSKSRSPFYPKKWFPFVVWTMALGLAGFVITGCASVETRTGPRYVDPNSLTKPDMVLIFDFAVSPQEVQLDEGWSAAIGRTAKGQEGMPKSQLELDVGHKVAKAFSESLVKELGKYGLKCIG